jgi:hypothetical protein
MLAPAAWIACSQPPVNPLSEDEQEELQSEQRPEPVLQLAEGELASVNTEMQLIAIRTPDGAERKFSYSDETQVEGAEDTVEGLAKKSGGTLRIHYQSLAPGTDVAKTVEVLEDKE